MKKAEKRIMWVGGLGLLTAGVIGGVAYYVSKKKDDPKTGAAGPHYREPVIDPRSDPNNPRAGIINPREGVTSGRGRIRGQREGVSGRHAYDVERENENADEYESRSARYSQ